MYTESNFGYKFSRFVYEECQKKFTKFDIEQYHIENMSTHCAINKHLCQLKKYINSEYNLHTALEVIFSEYKDNYEEKIDFTASIYKNLFYVDEYNQKRPCVLLDKDDKILGIKLLPYPFSLQDCKDI